MKPIQQALILAVLTLNSAAQAGTANKPLHCKEMGQGGAEATITTAEDSKSVSIEINQGELSATLLGTLGKVEEGFFGSSASYDVSGLFGQQGNLLLSTTQEEKCNRRVCYPGKIVSIFATLSIGQAPMSLSCSY